MQSNGDINDSTGAVEKKKKKNIKFNKKKKNFY